MSKNTDLGNLVNGLFVSSTRNVGIGTTTPAVAGGSFTGLDIRGSGGGSLVFGSTSTVFSYMYANSSALALDTTGTIPIVFQPGGTERMRITSAGNVGIGTSSPSAQLDVNSNIRIFTTSLTTSGTIGNLGFGPSGYGGITPSRITASFEGPNWYNGSNLIFRTHGGPDITAGEPTERMRISSTGDVGIGTSPQTGGSGGRWLTIDGTGFGYSGGLIFTIAAAAKCYMYTDTDSLFTIQATASQGIKFLTNNTEKMRITSGGDVCVSTTSPVFESAGRGCITIGGSSTSILSLKPGGNAGGYLYHNGSSLSLNNNLAGGVYVLASSGGVQLNNGATSWTSSSDERLKNINSNIEDAVSKLSSLRAVNFSWKSDETQKEVLGLIAQDVEKVFPQVVDKGKLPSNIDEQQIDKTEYLGVRYTELVPVLVKAIQELKAEIEILKNK